MVSHQSLFLASVIGSTELVNVAGINSIPAKIDTGADTSAIWASNIDMKKDGTLVFTLFDSKSPFYTGEKIETHDYLVKTVRSSHGDIQIRYRVKLPVTINGKSFVTTFTLANRSRNHFPVLIGRHTLEGRFLVDVERSCVERPSSKKSIRLNKEMREDPYKFHQKYLNNQEKKA